MRATTYGLGRVLDRVFSWKPPRVLLGLGGTATLDGGAGMARAIGYRFLGEKAEELDGTPEHLLRLHAIQSPARSRTSLRIRCVALCDVANTLTGRCGSATVFGPQKGASPEEVRSVGRALERLARVIERDLGIDVGDLPGAGAAGGLGAGCRAFLGGRLVPGAREVMRLTGFDRTLEGIDLIVTGEGSFDEGNRKGKVVSEIITLAARRGIPVVLLCGQATWRPRHPRVEIWPLGPLTKADDFRKAGKRLVQQRFS
jgi:glycerate kinase